MRRAFVYAGVGRWFVLALRAASMVVLARLLLPEEFGAFAIALPIMALAGQPGEFGLTSYLVRHPAPRREDFRVAVGVSALLTVGSVSLLALILSLLPETVLAADLSTLILVLAATLLLLPVAMPAQAMLQREMRFGTLALVDMARTAIQIAVAIALALAGWGALALALAFVAEQVAGSLLVMALAGRRCLVRPTLRGWREPVRFGRGFTLASGLSSLGDALTTLIIGRFLGLAAVGLFNRTTTLVGLVNKAVVDGAGQVMLPALVRERGAKGDLRAAYLAKVAFLTIIYWPFFGLLALQAEAVVALLLGGGWDGAVGTVRALCVMGLFMPFTQMSMKFFVALDATDEYVRYQTVTQVARIAMTAAGAAVSIELVCLMYGLSTYGVKALIVTPPLKRRIGVEARPLARTLLTGALLTALALAGPAAVTALLPATAGALGLAALLSTAGWLAGIYALRHPAAAEITALARRALRHLPAPHPPIPAKDPSP